MLSSVLYLLFSSTSVEAHSWIQCTDYRGNTDYYEGNQCFGHVRPWQRGNNDIVSPNQVAFGVDQGFNKMLHQTPDGQCNTLIDNQFAAGNFPMATYRRGQTVTLAWPAKNHVADTCDNNPGGAQIPDAFNGLYMEKSVPGLRITYNREVVFEPMTEGNTHVQGQIDYKGYQKCPKFCENRDKALCTGTFVVPNVPDGKYSFSWRWEFNGGRNPPETYVTCFEAMVQGEEIKPETGDKWDQGGVGMFVERGQGCNDHQDENRCLSYADGRNSRVGERCAWCCGETCSSLGGPGYPGGDNRCEPVSYLEQNGVKRYRTAGSDNCTPPTAEPTLAPTSKPTETPTLKPTAAPSETPTAVPTDPPTDMPTQMMAPSGTGLPNGSGAGAPGVAVTAGINPLTGAATQCAPLMGQCGGEGATTNCCQEGACVALNPFVWQCQPMEESKSSGKGVSMTTVLIAVFVTFLVALICGTVLVYKCVAGKDSNDDGYYKHNSLSDRETRGGRYDDRHERRRKDKKKKSRSRDDSRSGSRKNKDGRRRDSRSPRRTDSRNSTGSWVEDN